VVPVVVAVVVPVVVALVVPVAVSVAFPLVLVVPPALVEATAPVATDPPVGFPPLPAVVVTEPDETVAVVAPPAPWTPVPSLFEGDPASPPPEEHASTRMENSADPTGRQCDDSKAMPVLVPNVPSELSGAAAFSSSGPGYRERIGFSCNVRSRTGLRLSWLGRPSGHAIPSANRATERYAALR